MITPLFRHFAAFLLIVTSLVTNGQCPTVNSGEIDEGDETISGSCTLNQDILIKSGNITVTGTLTINGNLEYDVSGTTFLVDGGTVIVTGTFTNKNSGNVTITNSGSFTAGTGGDTGIRFDNQNSGTITVSGGGSLTVNGSYFNNGSGTTSFLDGSISISNDFDNNGNGTISSGGVVNIGGDLTQNGNGNLDITGGLTVGGTLSNKDGNVTVSDDAVLRANTIDFNGSGGVTIENGGTIAVDNVTGGTITNNAGNADQDCSNGCCGAQCDGTGTMLNDDALVVLPVELLYFNLSTEDVGIDVSWATASETNNERFELERSLDGSTFTTISSIKGAGNSSDLLAYSVRDFPESEGLVFYRITQIDFDGRSEQFEIKSIAYQPSGSNQIVYPTTLNVGSRLNIVNTWGEVATSDLDLVSLTGKRIQLNRLTVEGRNLQLTIPEVQEGIYVLKGQINGVLFNQKLVIE